MTKWRNTSHVTLILSASHLNVGYWTDVDSLYATYHFFHQLLSAFLPQTRSLLHFLSCDLSLRKIQILAEVRNACASKTEHMTSSSRKTVLRMRSVLAVYDMVCTHNLYCVLCVELYVAARLIVSHEIQAGRQLQ